ncbi:MAG: hypothetical protein KBT11_09270 [Treponema sp.]|nr:hypothetical protein [Candidatus Treponema equifaecale]
MPDNKTEKVFYKIRYIGHDSDYFEHNKIYLCTGEIVEGSQKGSIFVINELGENYVYSSEMFEKVTK